MFREVARRLLGEPGAQPATRPVQAGASGKRRDAERLRGLGRRQLLPADQHQELAVRLGHFRQRLEQRRSLRRLVGRELLAKLVPQPLGEAVAAARAATVVGEDEAGGAVEPEARLPVERHLAEAPPGDQEGLGDDVGRVIGIGGAAQRVAEQVARVVSIEAGEARLGELARQAVRYGGIAIHRPHMSGSAPALHPAERAT